MTTTHTIAVLPGDGIGPEIIAEAKKLLGAVGEVLGIEFNLPEAPIGGAGVDAAGVPLPEETLQLAKDAKVVLLGAVGGPKYDRQAPEIRPEQGLLQIRKVLGLYANLRPVTGYRELLHTSTLQADVVDGVDLLVVRELTGGLYFGQPKHRSDTEALDSLTYTRAEIERIAHVGFQAAQKRGKRLCSVDKANVLKTSQLWRDVVTEMASQYPDVELSHMYVDNAAMQLIRAPKQFDVMVTENMFGDILSDEASMLMGSLGMLPSASLGESGYALYEPSHGSAPDIAGQGIANPLATILSVAMLLEYSLNLPEAARLVEGGVTAALQQGHRTADITDGTSQPVTTQVMGDAVVAGIKAKAAVGVG